jgi:hypothetical protein
VVAVLEAEMAAELDGLARRHRDDPAAERRKLLLLALEREQIVAVSYRPEVIAEQVAHLDVGDDLRRLVTRAMAWVQRCTSSGSGVGSAGSAGPNRSRCCSCTRPPAWSVRGCRRPAPTRERAGAPRT